MGFNVDSSTFAEAKIVGISGQPGVGFFRLVVDVDFEIRARTEPATIVELGGELKVQANNVQHHVGRLVPQYPPVHIEARREARSERANLVVELDRRRLEGIEDLRLGGDITFTVSLNGRIATGTESHRAFENDRSLRLNQGSWVEVLAHLGYRRTMLLEVPIPDGDSSPELVEALKHLRHAHAALLRGGWRESVGCCRDVMESLDVALGEVDAREAEATGLFEKTRAMDKTARLGVVRRALKLMTHPARHADEVAAKFEWDRTDATTMLTMVSALLKRLA